MPGRVLVGATGYRYGFNGKENDNEVKGNGNQLDFGARIYDPRIGRFLSRDVYESNYPNMSSYAYGLNNPILLIDNNGNWVTDLEGNVIITYQSGKEELFMIGGEIKDDKGAVTGYSYNAVQGKYAYILSNKGEKVEVFIPSSEQVYRITADANHKQVGEAIKLDPKTTEGEKNCTTNGLLPDIPNMIISSDQITNKVLEDEGYIQAEPLSGATKNDPSLNANTSMDLANKGDIMVYKDDKGQPIHFEIFLDKNLVNTKGGTQQGPIMAKPGENKGFGSAKLWYNMNMAGQLDTKVTIPAEQSKDGLNAVSNSKFEKIQTDAKAKTP